MPPPPQTPLAPTEPSTARKARDTHAAFVVAESRALGLTLLVAEAARNGLAHQDPSAAPVAPIAPELPRLHLLHRLHRPRRLPPTAPAAPAPLPASSASSGAPAPVHPPTAPTVLVPFDPRFGGQDCYA